MELFDPVVAPLKVPNPPPVSINEDLILSCVRFEHAVRVEECRITGGNPDKRRDPGHLPDGSVVCSQLIELNLSFRHIANMSSLQGLRALRYVAHGDTVGFGHVAARSRHIIHVALSYLQDAATG